MTSSTQASERRWPRPFGRASAHASEPGRRKWLRRLGTFTLVLGVLALAYGATIYFWKDPVTDLYARWKQHQLAGELDQVFDRYGAGAPASDGAGSTTDAGSGTQSSPADEASSGVVAADPAFRRAVAADARHFLGRVEQGDPLGRLVIPKLDIHPVFVHGTRWGADLSRGPGHYEQTSLPGLGKVTAVAGHRTTFGAWFRNIDDLKRGDEIVLELPYGTFIYRVVAHEIVDNDDWSIIEPRGYDALVLSACHPLYSAKQRWIVYAKLATVETGRGTAAYASPATTDVG